MSLVICAVCRDIFDAANSVEEALVEAREQFGDLPLEELASVCEGCSDVFQAWMREHYGPPPWPRVSP